MIDPADPTGPNRSPYVVSLAEFVLRFGTSADRCRVLDGFLRYRARLHTAGLVQGFPWLDGSLLEHVELIEGRSPRDLAVVTFFRLPPGANQAQVRAQAPDAFPTTIAELTTFKSAFLVDAYLVDLNDPGSSWWAGARTGTACGRTAGMRGGRVTCRSI
jgi:hypothetical protein